MLFLMVVNLYASRVVLNVLGVEDYGIYNVVGGVVAMLGFLNAAMTASTQRYITFELGRGNIDRLKQVFSTSFNIHIIISIAIIVLGETIGLWFLNEKLVIPTDRFYAAFIVYQMSIISTVISILSYPFNAEIISHEKMSAFAYISIFEATMKLAAVIALAYFSFDKLVIYASSLTLIQGIVGMSYYLYCKSYFVEIVFDKIRDKSLFKEMLSFASWNLWGNLAAILFGQGLNILLNIFFGPAVNAARAVSVQVQGAIQQFSSNFQMALNPQITKNYAIGRLDDMHLLIYRSSRFSFYLLLVLCLPVLFETEYILTIWLKNVPQYSVIFIRIMIITMIIDSTSNPLMVSAQASGNIKKYQTIIGMILLAILPVSYVVLKCGYEPWSVFVVHLCICIIAFVARLFIIKPLIMLDLYRYFNQVILKITFVVVSAVICCFVSTFIISNGAWGPIINIVFCGITSLICCLFIGLDRHERSFIMSRFTKYLNK